MHSRGLRGVSLIVRVPLDRHRRLASRCAYSNILLGSEYCVRKRNGVARRYRASWEIRQKFRHVTDRHGHDRCHAGKRFLGGHRRAFEEGCHQRDVNRIHDVRNLRSREPLEADIGQIRNVFPEFAHNRVEELWPLS
jgi:hypothetical protein